MISNFGERLKAARKMAGLSMEALAEKSGSLITKQAIGKYEKGLMKPSGEVLMALSGALGVKPNYFFRPPHTDFSNLNFRKRSNLKAKEIAEVKHKALDFLERYLEIEEILSEKGAFANPIPSEMRGATDLGDIERAARRVRTEWGLGVAPVSNLIELLEDHGFRIIEVESNEKFDGISAWADNIPIIAVRKQNDAVRKRFTIAHELGHVLLEFGVSEGASSEKPCHDFAGAFLLPETVIRSELGEHRDRIALEELIKIKEIYGISIQAIMYRAKRLAIIGDRTYMRFCINVNQKGWKKNEPGSYQQREVPSRFRQLVCRAVAEEVITYSRAAELLDTSLSEVRNMEILS